MAAIVLVHGIAQEQKGPETLLKEWLPAMADGIEKYGQHDLAARIYNGGRRGDLDVQMAYYGDLFENDVPLDGDFDLDTTPLPPGTDESLVAELADTVLHAAANDARSDTDRDTASNAIAALSGAAGEEQGPRALARPLLNALSRLRWFADPTMKLAAPLVWRTLTQVTRYLSDGSIRTCAQERVLELIGPDTKLLIGHSLGSVVAFEALHRCTRQVALITLGSPLGLSTIVYDKLEPRPPHVPPSATHWYNFAAEDDLVAARLDLAPFFPPAPGRGVTPLSHIVDTGSKPHDIVHYLTKPSCGQAIARSLTAQ